MLNTAPALISIRNVSHHFQTDTGPLHVLDGLDLDIGSGQFTAVVGPSGCGKSTLTRLVAGLMTPDSGEVMLHGERVKGPRSTVGMAFQNPVLLEWRSILRNVMLPLEIVPDRVPAAEHEERARALLELVGLAGPMICAKASFLRMKWLSCQAARHGHSSNLTCQLARNALWMIYTPAKQLIC